MDVAAQLQQDGKKGDTMFDCYECGEQFFIDIDGTAHHWGAELDNIDHDADANHVPYNLAVLG